MKIALYARVSTDTQTKDGTIDSQIEALKDYAKKHKLDIAFECLDDGYSGTTLDRPGLDQVRDLAQSGKIEGILILSPDRLSRSLVNQYVLMDEFKKRNIQIIFTSQNFSGSPEDNFMLNIQGVVSEYERTKILERMRRGTIHAVKNGQVNGGNSPYGYKYIPKSKNSVGYWEINQDEAETVRYIFDLYVNEKMTGTKIAARLNNEHVPCRSIKWWGSQIYDILKNETYTGTAHMFKMRSVEPKKSPKQKEYRKKKNSSKTLRSRDEWIGIPVAQIIDKEIWSKAQELLKRNASRSIRNNKKHQYLLRGLVLCGVCGCTASGYVSHNSTYYSCGAKRARNITSNLHDEKVQVSHRFLDEKVWLGLTELLSDPNNLKMQIEERIPVKRVKLRPVTDDFSKEIEQLDIQEKRILDAYREEVISLVELKEQKEKISERRKVLEAKKTAVISPAKAPERPEISLAMLGDISTRFQRVMAKADFPTRERLVNLLVNSVTLMPNKAVVLGNIPIESIDALTTARQGALFNNI